MDSAEENLFRNPRSASIISPAASNFARGSFNSSNKFYKGQAQCFLCEKSFSKSPESKLKRYCCQFCYNAVCQSCSPLTLQSAITGKTERCCISCFKAHTKEQIDQDAEKIYKQVLSNETELRISESNARKEVETKYEELKKLFDEQKHEKNKEIEDIKEKLGLKQSENDEKNKEIVNLKKSLDLEQKRIEENNKEISELKVKCKDLEKKLAEKSKLTKESMNENGTNNGEQMINDLKEEVRVSKEEIEVLKKKVQVLMSETKASSCGCCIT